MMKQKDIALILLITGSAAVFSYFISNKYITPPNEKLNAEIVTEITPDFTPPESKYFNSESVNPTVKIEIAPNDNQTPFDNESQ